MEGKPANNDIDDELAGGMETRTRIYLSGIDRNMGPLVDKVENTTIGMGGMTESVEIFLRQAAGCNHILHVGAEVGAVCANPGCHAVLYVKCAADKDSICDKCGKPVCGSCQKEIWLRSEDTIQCPPCARRWWTKEIRRAVIVALLAFLFLVVLLR